MDDGDPRRHVASSGGAEDRSVISKIMQRFRPIAPKPTAGGSVGFDDTKGFVGRSRRSKRKYVRHRSNSNNNSSSNRTKYKIKKMTRSRTEEGLDKDTDRDGIGSGENIVTLQLLPEKEEDLGARESTVFGCTDSECTESRYRDPLPVEDLIDRTVVESWVTVECVTGTCTEENIRNQLGCTDGERVRWLEVDTCPGFVSDGLNRVVWVNGSYRRMMGLKLNGREDVRVWVVGKVDEMEEIMACMGELYGAVTCKVSVRYECTWRKEKSRSMTVPCDVWKMGSGGFAWRLDIEAALSL